MSRFFSEKYAALTPYTPGEQPKDQRYVKLNTNESPFPPSPLSVKRAQEAARGLQLYPDPECRALTEKLCSLYDITPDEILWGNGSDEVLNFAFMAFCDQEHPAAFPDISYGFYRVFAQLCGIPYEEIPLTEDLRIEPRDYCGIHKTIVIANPNAPTGLLLSLAEIEMILKSNPGNVVIIDEAYIDFGGDSCVKLIRQYPNLLVTQTFSKSRSMAGGRLGMAMGDPALIRDLNTIKYSTNPYNINAMTMAAGIGVLEDEEYTRANCRVIRENRAYLSNELSALGFAVIPSQANFVFARHRDRDGRTLYERLKANGVLVRHFDHPRIRDFLRITIGSRAQLDTLLDTLKQILEE